MEDRNSKVKELLANNWKLIVMIICIIGFLMLAKSVFYKEIMEADVAGHNFVITYLMSDFGTSCAKFITNFGGGICLILITIISFIVIKNKKIGGAISLNLAIQTILNLTIKNIFQRPRPIEYRLIEETGYSFPSGHSMASMAFYGFIIYLIYKNIKNKYIKWISIILLSILILAIGFSRIYLGVHYTSDVLGGFLLTIAYLMVYTSVIKNKI
ncbi:MAG: phosphatase PAP2 family protein [Clostridia bacterium]|nr:phosphatase PAP2 family protein [Clostridia bacterium]